MKKWISEAVFESCHCFFCLHIPSWGINDSGVARMQIFLQNKLLFHWVFPFYGWSAQLIRVFINTHLFSLSVSSTAAADSAVLGQVKFFSTSNQWWFMALIMMKFHLSHSRSLRRLLIKQHSISPSSSATYSATSSPHPMKLKGDNQVAWLWCTMLCYIFCSFPKHLSPLFWGCNKLLKGESV